MANMNLQAAFNAVAGEIDDLRDEVAGSQIWLPAVATEAGLPAAYGTPADFVRTKTYLCRVTGENNVFQCVARETGNPEWLLYSSNTDYVDEQELADAIEDNTDAWEAAVAAEAAARTAADALKVNTATASTEIMVNWR